MNSHQMQSAVHSYCELYGAAVEEFEAGVEMAAVEDGRIVIVQTAPPTCTVRHSAVPEEGPAQLEAGRRGLMFRQVGDLHLLRPLAAVPPEAVDTPDHFLSGGARGRGPREEKGSGGSGPSRSAR